LFKPKTLKNYLQATYFFDYEDPAIVKLAQPFLGKPINSTLIKEIFEFSRDFWRYNPYHIGLTKDAFRASSIALKSSGHCIDKAIILITLYRKVGIPARLRLAKVFNHLAVDKLIEKLGSSDIAPHGIVEIYFQGKWLKASNAFNKELCEIFKVNPLQFDGTEEAIFQEFNADNLQFMEYLEDYGSFEDVPLQFILDTFRSHYPVLFQKFEGKDEIRI
jgi:transglutaminase-like putative cysteine protease